MMEEKFKWRVTNSWLRCFYRRVPRGVLIQMQLLCLWTCYTIHVMFLFWVDFPLFPLHFSFLCLADNSKSVADSFFFFCISQPIVTIVRVIEKSHSPSNGMRPIVLTAWSRRDHCKSLIHDYAIWSNAALQYPLFLWTEDAQCSLNTSKATFIQRACCYVGLLLWRSLSPCHWDGQLWPCHREEPFLSLPPAWGSQQGFLPHNAKNKVVIHSL